MSSQVIKIANCSGYYGDKLSAAKDMIDGGPIDVLTGDYVAELTMTILCNRRLQRGEDKGYVSTFLKQVKEIAKDCKEKNIKIVTNAGGLNPSSMADEIEKILEELSIDMRVAYIDGDDLMPRMEELNTSGEEFINIDKNKKLNDSGYTTLTANAYLGAWVSRRIGSAHSRVSTSAPVRLAPRSSKRHRDGIKSWQRRRALPCRRRSCRRRTR